MGLETFGVSDFSPSINILRNPATFERQVSHRVFPLHCHTHQPPENVFKSLSWFVKEISTWPALLAHDNYRHFPQAYSACLGNNMFYRRIQFILAVESSLFCNHSLSSNERWNLNCLETMGIMWEWDCIWQRCTYASAKKPVPAWISHILRTSSSTRFHSCSLDLLPSLLAHKNNAL